MTEKICSVDGCERAHAARGWCKRHYYAWRRNGDLLPRRSVDGTQGCLVEGCDAKHKAKGYCKSHYKHYKWHGSPYKQSWWFYPENIWQRVGKENEDGCWNWKGSTTKDGYPQCWDGNKGSMNRAHRAIYEFMVGEIPEGLTLDHLCCNIKCVNPAHMEPVTNQENKRRGGEPHFH